MTRQEIASIHEQMRAYKAEGHTNKEVALKFGYSCQRTQIICAGICNMSHEHNQYTDGRFDRVANAARLVKERLTDFEYVEGFSNCDGTVVIRCKTCGTEIKRSLISIRHKKVKCPECAKHAAEVRKLKQRERQQQKAQERKSERYRQKMLARTYKQSTMKTCSICGALYTGNRKYCSDKCLNNNRWRMKDGYRYLFPLEEVYQRDGGICYLCGGLCDWDDWTIKDGVKIYGDMYPSRDHIIPKSKGGSNSWDNIKLAHRACNSRKNNSPLVKK